MGFVPVDKLKAAARPTASITEYLTAVLMLSIMENQKAEKPRHEKPVALAIPHQPASGPVGDSAQLHPAVRPCIDPELGDYTLRSWWTMSIIFCA